MFGTVQSRLMYDFKTERKLLKVTKFLLGAEVVLE